MSAIKLPDAWMEKLSDWMNPILVKETRQSLKSRQFVISFMLLLLACWLVCIFGVSTMGDALQYTSASTGFQQGFYMVLSIAVMIVIPFTAFQSFKVEQDSQTYELLSITSLSPRQIVLGKLFNSVMVMIVFYCAITPFIAFTSLLQGFDLLRAATILSILFATSLLLCVFTLMLGAMARTPVLSAASTFLVLGGLIFAYSTMAGVISMLSSGFMEIDSDFLWMMVVYFVIGASYFFLFLQITISHLTFDAANKSTGVRFIAQGQFLLFWIILLVITWANSGGLSQDLLNSVLTFSIIHWAIFGFFISTERDYLSRRVRRDLPKSKLLRFVLTPFMPGGTRGYLLLLINLAIITALTQLIDAAATYGGADFQKRLQACMAYVAIYLGIGCLLTRWLLRISHDMQPVHGRTILGVLFAMGSTVPYFILWSLGHYKYYNPDYSLLHITNPFETLSAVNADVASGVEGIMLLLMLGVMVAVGLNFIPMLRSIREIVMAKVPQPNRRLSEQEGQSVA